MNDLEHTNPTGRLDVLAYRVAGHFIGQLEKQHGISGIWDNIKAHVAGLASDTLGHVKLPTEAEIILRIIQANHGGKK